MDQYLFLSGQYFKRYGYDGVYHVRHYPGKRSIVWCDRAPVLVIETVTRKKVVVRDLNCTTYAHWDYQALTAAPGPEVARV